MRGKMMLFTRIFFILIVVAVFPIDGMYLYGKGGVLYVGGEGDYSNIQ